MKLEINPWLSHTINVLAVVLCVGFAIYITKSSWCLLGLLFCPDLKHTWKNRDDYIGDVRKNIISSEPSPFKTEVK